MQNPIMSSAEKANERDRGGAADPGDHIVGAPECGRGLRPTGGYGSVGTDISSHGAYPPNVFEDGSDETELEYPLPHSLNECKEGNGSDLSDHDGASPWPAAEALHRLVEATADFSTPHQGVGQAGNGDDVPDQRLESMDTKSKLEVVLPSLEDWYDEGEFLDLQSAPIKSPSADSVHEFTISERRGDTFGSVPNEAAAVAAAVGGTANVLSAVNNNDDGVNVMAPVVQPTEQEPSVVNIKIQVEDGRTTDVVLGETTTVDGRRFLEVTIQYPAAKRRRVTEDDGGRGDTRRRRQDGPISGLL
ncbi:hypothetical protein RJ55_06876 [Drechmeria coniospora]|nr:hypothetical protein RJ55_06876 [Drechmeria coniospora]